MPADPDLIATLRPVRLPGGFEAFSWPLVCAAFSLGILLALLAILALRLVTDRRESRLGITRRELAAASQLPDGERLFAQAALLDRLTAEHGEGPSTAGARATGAAKPSAAGTDLRRAIGEQLYKPGAAPDFDAIDTVILKLAAERRIGRTRRGALWSRRFAAELPMSRLPALPVSGAAEAPAPVRLSKGG